MGNKSSNNNTFYQNSKNVVNSSEIKKNTKNISQNRKKELIYFLLSNATILKNIKKVTII